MIFYKPNKTRVGFYYANPAEKIFRVFIFLSIIMMIYIIIPQVSWFKMAEALNMKWTSACGSNRGLTEENFYFLATKAFR